MWFVLLAIALSVLLVGGIYFGRRVSQSLEVLGVSPRGLRIFRWALLWLLFGYPLLIFAYIAGAIALGRSESFALTPTGILTWLLVYPFWISVLVMLQSVPFFLAIDLGRAFFRKRARVKNARRYSALCCAAVVAFFVIYTPTRIIAGKNNLNIHRYEVGDGETSPLRLVFFGDLQRGHHASQERSDEVVSIINREDPDLVLVGGDWINSGPDFISEAARSGGQLQSRLGVWSVRGDHEHFAYRDQDRSVREISRALAENDVELIDNELRWIEHEGKRIGIVFLSYNYIYRTPDGDIRQLLTEVRDADTAILVTHQFDETLAALAKDHVDLVLAAHTHGGQVNPLVGLVHVPLARVETSYVEGRYSLGERTTVIVTAGIGYSIAPFRYASPASIEVIELRP